MLFFTCILASSNVAVGANLPIQLKSLSTSLSSLNAKLNKLQSQLKNLKKQLKNKPSHTPLLPLAAVKAFFKSQENMKYFQAGFSGFGFEDSYKHGKITDEKLNTFLIIFRTNFNQKTAAQLLSLTGNSGQISWINALNILLRKGNNDLKFFAKKVAEIPDDKTIDNVQLTEITERLKGLRNSAIQVSITPNKLQIPVSKATDREVETFFKNDHKARQMLKALFDSNDLLEIKKTSDQDLKCFLTAFHDNKKTLFDYIFDPSTGEKLWITILKEIQGGAPVQRWFILKMRELVDGNFSESQWNDNEKIIAPPAAAYDW